MSRAWIILIISAGFEAVWATALGASDGLTHLVPSIVFGVAVAASVLGLATALRHIPVGTGYAVWTGLGAALTVGWAMATGSEPTSLLRAVLLLGIIGATAGLALTERPAP